MAQKKFASTVNDRGELVYDGRITFDDLLKEKEFGWMKDAETYMPDKASLSYLHLMLPSYNIVTVIGTWCEDSHNLIPKLYKVLLSSQYPMEQFTMYGVDRNKKTTSGATEKYHITNIPSIIVMQNGKEIGRITETAKQSVEADLTAILKAAQ